MGKGNAVPIMLYYGVDRHASFAHLASLRRSKIQVAKLDSAARWIITRLY